MDERTEIDNHGNYLRKLTFNKYHGERDPASEMNVEIIQMKRRFAHTFFHPNRYTKDYHCKHCLTTPNGGCCAD